jgi:hypothetical protein
MMKKFLIVLAIIGFVFISCNSETEVVEGPAAALQGKWYQYGNSGNLLDYYFIEFKGNTMRYYNNGFGSEYTDSSDPFTCTEDVITVRHDYIDENGKPDYTLMIIPYEITEKELRTGTYTAIHFSKTSTFYPNTYWCKKINLQQTDL